MKTKRGFKTVMDRFSLRGIRGFIILGVVLIAVFWLGGALSGDDSGRGLDGGHDHAETDRKASVKWTCSMHPQYQLPEAGKCPICFMDLIPVESSADKELDPSQLRMSNVAVELARIQTTPVFRGQAEPEISVVGRIDYDETRLVEITAWVSGRIDDLYADYTGAAVSRGEPLVRIYSPGLLTAQEELIKAVAAERELSKSSSRLLKSTASATTRAAREKLRLLGLTPEQVSSLERSGLATEMIIIHSPVGGVVVDKPAREGMYVNTGDRLVTVADLTHLWVTFEAFESDLPWLQPGQTAEFTAASLPGRSFEASISFLDPFVEPVRRTVKIRAEVDNPNGLLKPDMLVQGRIKSGLSPASEAGAPLLIPVQAPLLTGKRAVVYVDVTSTGDPVFEGREVVLGPRAGDYYIVKSGLAEGDRVVTNGAFKIDSELQIQARPSMMAPAGGIQLAGHQHQHGTPAETVPAKSEFEKIDLKESESKKVRQALGNAYDRYFDVQMALAKDDLETATGAAGHLLKQVKLVDETQFSAEAGAVWLKAAVKLSQHAGSLSRAKDLAAARDHFFHLSNEMIELHEIFGHSGDQNYYLTFCPMARDNQGAHWLQTEDIVWNSFWGDMMLRCGSIKGTLPPADSK